VSHRSHFLAFNLEALSRVLAALPSQSVIGELNLLTIVMLGSGRESRQTGYKSPLSEHFAQDPSMKVPKFLRIRPSNTLKWASPADQAV
jgi:hypothetical protein